jgi:hypothetical protein
MAVLAQWDLSLFNPALWLPGVRFMAVFWVVASVAIAAVIACDEGDSR